MVTMQMGRIRGVCGSWHVGMEGIGFTITVVCMIGEEVGFVGFNRGGCGELHARAHDAGFREMMFGHRRIRIHWYFYYGLSRYMYMYVVQ